MDTARYGLGWLAIVGYPSAFLFWTLAHPFAPFWRRVGPGVAYPVMIGVVLVFSWSLHRICPRLLRADYGTHWYLLVLGILLAGIAMIVDARCRREISVRTLLGVPELAGDGRSGRLLQNGIYAEIRHPRYLATGIGLIAIALLANHLAVYVLTVVCLPFIYLVSLLEERELVDRFGETYRTYRASVPRFIPTNPRSLIWPLHGRSIRAQSVLREPRAPDGP